MKIVFKKVPASSRFKAGETIEATGAELDTLTEAGHEFVTAAEHEAQQRIVKSRETGVDNAITKARARGALLPKEEVTELRAKALKMEEFSDGMGIEHIDGLPAKEDPTKASQRQTTGHDAEVGALVKAGELSFRDTYKEYCTASEPFRKTIKNGGIIGSIGSAETKETEQKMAHATQLARAKGAVVQRLCDMVRAGADYRWDDVVKAADYVDPAGGNPLGTLNVDMLLNFNFGYLENQLALLDDITTDISDQPIKLNQRAVSRYIQVPGFQSKASGVAWAPATGATVDVDIKMSNYIGVPLAWNENYIGATTRNLPNEFRTPQMYSIGEAIIYYLVNNIINGNARIANDGATSTTIKPNAKFDGVNAGKPFPAANASLSTFISALPAAMDYAKFPGGDEADEEFNLLRFAWVHTSLYAAATSDTNAVLNQTLQRISAANGNRNPNLLTTGRLNRLGNIIFRKSQLMSDKLTLTADPNNASSNVVSVGDPSTVKICGAAGTRSGLMFCSRLPLDYTKLIDVQGGFAVEVATTPRLGIKLSIVKFLDHAYETANVRATIMFGTAIGDERQIGPLSY